MTKLVGNTGKSWSVNSSEESWNVRKYMTTWNGDHQLFYILRNQYSQNADPEKEAMLPSPGSGAKGKLK